jgi:hypothetical protein
LDNITSVLVDNKKYCMESAFFVELIAVIVMTISGDVGGLPKLLFSTIMIDTY